MKMPCELIVTHILPTARGALAKELGAAVSQYIKGLRGGNNLIDKSAYREDFYKMIADTADVVANGKDLTEALCEICTFVKTSGLLKALYVYEGYSGELGVCMECPRTTITIPEGL